MVKLNVTRLSFCFTSQLISMNHKLQINSIAIERSSQLCFNVLLHVSNFDCCCLSNDASQNRSTSQSRNIFVVPYRLLMHHEKRRDLKEKHCQHFTQKRPVLAACFIDESLNTCKA